MKCNRAELADIFGRDARTIDKMVKEGMPYLRRPGEDGSTEWLFDTTACIDWLVDRDGTAEKRDRDKESKSKQLEAEAGLKWLAYGRELKMLVPIDKILPVFEEAASIIKSRLRAIPGRLAQKVAVESDPATVQRLIKIEIDDALTELNRDFESFE